MASFWEKTKTFLSEFFSEDDDYINGDPVTLDGKVFLPYRPENDEWSQWPNAPCAACGGLQLKKYTYFSKDSQTYYHPECLQGLVGAAAPVAAPQK